MKKIFLIAGILFFTYSQALPKKKFKKYKAEKIRIIKQGKCEGHNTYKVILPSGKVYEYMYMEEIKASMKSGKWKYNEDLILKK